MKVRWGFMQEPKSRNKLGSLLSLFVLLATVAAFLAIVFYRQPLIDHYYQSQYSPSLEEVSLREDYNLPI